MSIEETFNLACFSLAVLACKAAVICYTAKYLAALIGRTVLTTMKNWAKFKYKSRVVMPPNNPLESPEERF